MPDGEERQWFIISYNEWVSIKLQKINERLKYCYWEYSMNTFNFLTDT